MKQSWRTYEEVATYLLSQFAKEFGLARVEGKQKIAGLHSGTQWEIDAKGVREGNEGFVIIECRRYATSKQNQEKVGGLAYRIIDTGAAGGILFNPLGMQEGASKIAAAENIVDVRLDGNSTPYEFIMQFLNKIMVGLSDGIVLGDSAIAEVIRTCGSCGKKFTVKENEKVCPNCLGE
jgi:hypothetical protein